MIDFRYSGDCRNSQAVLRAFEDDLDDLLDALLAGISEAMPERYVEVFDDEEAVRRIGNVIAIADAVIEDGLHEHIDEAFADFSWKLTRVLRALREAVR